jgi:hypothetical protein
VVVVEGAINATFVAGTITMLVIGVLLHIVGLGIFCWALFALATYALPLFIGMTAGIYTYQTGAGPFGAIVVGFVTSDFILVAGQWAFFHRTLPHRPPYHWAAIRDSGRTRRVSCDPYPCTPWYSRGMVANVVRGAWRHRCRGHRLGACVDADRPRPQTESFTQHSSAAE